MGAARFNLGGEWSGDYAYPRHALPATPFVARIEDRDGYLTGTIIEPSALDGTVIEASIEGRRRGTAVDFVKLYGAAAPPGYERPVDYVGRLSDDGNSITGIWSLLDMDGSFEMHRQPAAEEQHEDEEQIALSEPVPR